MFEVITILGCEFLEDGYYLRVVLSSIWFGGIETYWTQKIVQEKQTNSQKSWTIASLHANFYVPKCLDIPILYCLQEESKHFGLKVLKNFGLGYRKIGKIQKDFWTIPSLHMSQNVLIPPNHILRTYTKSILSTSANFSHHLASTLLTLYHSPPNLYYLLSVRIGSIPFFLIFWNVPVPPFCWMLCYRDWFFAYIFFTCFGLFKSITP